MSWEIYSMIGNKRRYSAHVLERDTDPFLQISI